MPIKIKTKDPELQPLIDLAVGSAALCKKQNGDCTSCPSAIRKFLHGGVPNYNCRLGLHVVRESYRRKAEGKNINEEDIARVEVGSRAYAGSDTGYVLEHFAVNLMMTNEPKSLNELF